MTDYSSIVATYESFLERFLVRLSPEQHILLARYLDELSQWNRAFNLTGLSDIDEIVRHLLLDSLICAAQLPDHGLVLDVGSGAGFPAIPVKIYRPSVGLYALESNRKRGNFLKHLKRILRLKGFLVITERLEEHRKKAQGVYEAITARAVMPPLDLLPLCFPLLKQRGTIVLFLGKEGERLVGQLLERGKTVGFTLGQLISYKLPGAQTERYLALFHKRSDCPWF